MKLETTNRRLGYERVYLPLHKVADTPFHIQDDKCSGARGYKLGMNGQGRLTHIVTQP